MFKLHHDTRTFDTIFSALLEHGNFYNTCDNDIDYEDLMCWEGHLDFIMAPIDLAIMLVDSNRVSLISSCRRFLITATKDLEDSRYRVELCYGNCERIDQKYHQSLAIIRQSVLKEWQNLRHYG